MIRKYNDGNGCLGDGRNAADDGFRRYSHSRYTRYTPSVQWIIDVLQYCGIAIVFLTELYVLTVLVLIIYGILLL